MKKQIYNFNLIEIILTVAVVAFGVVVILGMLPKGLKAAKAAGFESYSSEIVDQLGSYMQLKGAASITAKVDTAAEEKSFVADFESDGDTDRKIMSRYPELVEYIDLSKSFSDSDFKRTNTAGVFKLNNGSANWEKDLYVIVMGDRVTDTIAGDTETNVRIDFSGMLRVWKRPREYERVRLNHGSGVTDHLDAGHDCLSSGCESRFELEVVEVPLTGAGSLVKGATVCMELSYPLSLPYAERTKRYYSFDVGE